MKKILISLLLLVMILPGIPVNAGAEYATVFNPETGDRKVVEIGDPNAFDGGYLLEVARAYEVPEDSLGFSVVTDYSKNLSSSINATQSTVPVTSITTKDDVALTMGVLGSKVFLIIEPGKRKEEIIMCTGISGTSWTGCTRGLAFYGTSTASVAANRETHSASSQIIISNTHYVYDELVDKDSDETAAGNKTFTGTTTFSKLPLGPAVTPWEETQFITKFYADQIQATSTYWIRDGANIYYTTGNVSVGTSTNKDVLHVTGTVKIDADGDNGIFELSDTSIGPNILVLEVLANRDFSFSGVSSSDYNLRFRNTGAGDIDVNIEGGLGVGTSSPTYDFGVVGDSSFTGTSTFYKAPVIYKAPIEDNEATRKDYADETYIVISLSDNLKFSMDSPATTTDGSYEIQKEIEMRRFGQARFKFDLKTDNGASACYGKIYKDDVAFGTEKSTTNLTDTTQTDDIVIDVGADYSLYTHGSNGDKCVTRNFRVYFDRTASTTDAQIVTP